MSNPNEAKMDMSTYGEMPSRSLSNIPTRSSTDLTIALAYERNQISERLEQLERAIKVNPEGVSDHHKSLLRKQAEAMRTYKEVLGERIKDLIDN